MAERFSAGPRVLLTTVLLAAATGAWWWQQDVFRVRRVVEVRGEPWDRVKGERPIPDEPAAVTGFSQDFLEAFLRSNPFSPKRRAAPPPAVEGAGTGAQGAAQQPPPQFVYKGRVNLGKRQRVIVEDTTTGKTYFLEVGQEVAGFKVLDIGETRVVLSDPQTGEQMVISFAAPEDSAGAEQP